MNFCKKLQLHLFSSLFLIIFLSGCVPQLNKQGLGLSLSPQELSESFSESFPLKKDFVFGTISIDNPIVDIPKNSQRVITAMNLNFQTMFSQKIKGEFSISGEPLFNKESSSIFLQNIKIENFKFAKLQMGKSFTKTFLGSLNPMLNEVLKKYPIYTISKDSFKGRFVKDIKIEDSKLLITYGF